MIKDLSETVYYCSIADAMEKNEKDQELMTKMREYATPQQISQHYYPVYYDERMIRDMDRDIGRMYYPNQQRDSKGRFVYDGGNGSGNNSGGASPTGGNNGYTEPPYYHMMPQYPSEMRDMREGRSPMNRRSYIESKEMNKGKEVQIQELDKYMQELANDVTEMIKDASPEEKQMLQQKLTLLAGKVVK